MKKAVLLLFLIALAGAVHSISQYYLFSLFQIITSIPLLLAFISPAPTFLVVCTFILFELYSSLPLGSMVLMFGIPYGVLFVWKKLKVELSWKYFFGVLLIILLQNIALFCIVAVSNGNALSGFSWFVSSMQLLVTTSVTFALSFIYHEYSQRL